jgi:hypothetical protein
MTRARVRDGARCVAKRDVVKHCGSHKKAACVLEKLQISSRRTLPPAIAATVAASRRRDDRIPPCRGDCQRQRPRTDLSCCANTRAGRHGLPCCRAQQRFRTSRTPPCIGETHPLATGYRDPLQRCQLLNSFCIRMHGLSSLAMEIVPRLHAERRRDLCGVICVAR